MEVLLACRAYIFELMHLLFAQEPTQDLINVLSSEESLQVFDIYTDGKPEFISTLDITKLQKEYFPLFIGPDKMPALPWESVYKTGHRVLFQQNTLEVRKLYLKHGLIALGYPNEADDHIAIELYFIMALAKRTTDAFSNNDTKLVKELAEAQLHFLDKHLDWVHKYAADIDSALFPCYHSISWYLCKLIETDKQVLIEFIKS